MLSDHQRSSSIQIQRKDHVQKLRPTTSNDNKVPVGDDHCYVLQAPSELCSAAVDWEELQSYERQIIQTELREKI